MCVIIVAYKGTQGRIVSSFMHSRRLTLCVDRKVQREDLREIMRDISLEMLKNISLCLASFTQRFESYVGEEGYLCMITSYVHALILPMFRVIGSCIMTYIILLCHCFRCIACSSYKFLFCYVFIC